METNFPTKLKRRSMYQMGHNGSKLNERTSLFPASRGGSSLEMAYRDWNGGNRRIDPTQVGHLLWGHRQIGQFDEDVQWKQQALFASLWDCLAALSGSEPRHSRFVMASIYCSPDRASGYQCQSLPS